MTTTKATRTTVTPPILVKTGLRAGKLATNHSRDPQRVPNPRCSLRRAKPACARLAVKTGLRGGKIATNHNVRAR